MVLNALIIDDEEFGRENMKNLLISYCPEICIKHMASSAQQAREILANDENINVVFSDIEMPGESGFEILPSLEGKNISLVFVTAHDKYALKAIKASALDFILKPIDVSDLKNCVKRILDIHARSTNNISEVFPSPDILKNLLANFMNNRKINKITLPSLKGFKVINTDGIIYIEGDDNYTTVFSDDGKFVLSKTLKDFENILDGDEFFRVHKSHIINISRMKEFLHEDGGVVVLDNGSRISISRRKLPEFLEKMKNMSLHLKK